MTHHFFEGGVEPSKYVFGIRRDVVGLVGLDDTERSITSLREFPYHVPGAWDYIRHPESLLSRKQFGTTLG